MNVRSVVIVRGGVVQGVDYRDFVHHVATELNLTGYVENIKDKTVRIICEGPKEQIEKFASLIRIREYPIKVSNVTI
ncbi:MAG TPA: acylphosphatase [archaeon]|nr:acylphosphatase [archaeon]